VAIVQALDSAKVVHQLSQWVLRKLRRCSHALPLDIAWERTQNGLRISFLLKTNIHAKSEIKHIHAPSASSVSETVRIGPMWFTGFNL
jgi:hypothetical protein